LIAYTLATDGRIDTMDIGWDSNNNDADEGKLNAGVHKDDDADI
jgi:hypothetical protein